MFPFGTPWTERPESEQIPEGNEARGGKLAQPTIGPEQKREGVRAGQEATQP
jgi:hypothetical protein